LNKKNNCAKTSKTILGIFVNTWNVKKDKD